MASNIILLPSTQGLLDVTGEPVVGTSYTMSLGSQYTVGIYAANLTGQVFIEATLVTNPQESDWFPIVLDGQPNPYVQFPYGGNATTTGNGLQLVASSFYGNFTWIRARLNRDYLGLGSPSPPQISALGYVDHVSLAIGGATGFIDSNLSNSGGIGSVTLTSLGTGDPLFANSTGLTDVVLSFKSLAVSNGITFTDDGSTITLSATNGGSNVVNFTDLADAPHAITNYGVLVGLANAVAFTAAPSIANTVLNWTGAGFSWVTQPVIPAVIPTVLTVQANGTNVVSNTATINFTGNAVQVSNVAGVPTVTLNYQPQPPQVVEGPSTEYVMIQYTAGSTGTLNAGDALISNTSGVTATITDVNNCLINFTFTGYNLPPSSIALMGQIVSTNQFVYQNINPSIGTRLIQSGGTAQAPNLLGNFTGPITLQVRMIDTGASAGIGQRAQAIILFKF